MLKRKTNGLSKSRTTANAEYTITVLTLCVCECVSLEPSAPLSLHRLSLSMVHHATSKCLGRAQKLHVLSKTLRRFFLHPRSLSLFLSRERKERKKERVTAAEAELVTAGERPGEAGFFFRKENPWKILQFFECWIL